MKSRIVCIKGIISRRVLINSEDKSKFRLRNVQLSLYYKGFVQIRKNKDGTWSLLRTLQEGKG